MKSTILTATKVNNAKNFRNNLTNPTTPPLYLYIGRKTAWPTDSNPPQYIDSADNNIDTRGNIEYLLKINYADTALAIPLITWALGTVYPAYNRATDVKSSYVMTSNNNVYKCLGNNNGGASSITPTGTSVNTIITSDGYQWKFMYNLNITIANKFLTDAYTPVPTDTQETNEQKLVESTAHYTTGDPPGGHGSNIPVELNADFVIITTGIVFSNISSDEFEHRQFGLISGIKDLSGNSLSAASYIIDSASTVNTASGDLLTITNHQVVDSSGDQSETIQIVLSF